MASDGNDSLQELLARLDAAKAEQLLSAFSEREVQVLFHRAQMMTYKEIARAIPVSKTTGNSVSEVYVRKILEGARKRLGVKDNHEVVIAFMVARIRCNLPVYRESHLSGANETIAQASADQSIERVIEALSSKELQRLVTDSQSSGPKARRAKFGRYAVTIEIFQSIVLAAALVLLGIAIAIGFDLYLSN